MIISEYHAYKTIWMLYIVDLNYLSVASSYQEWFPIKIWASNETMQALFSAMLKHSWVIIETSVYTEWALFK